MYYRLFWHIIEEDLTDIDHNSLSFKVFKNESLTPIQNHWIKR